MPTSFAPPVSAEHPELFFALVAPVGVEIQAVVNALDTELSAVGYELKQGRKLAELLHALPPWEALGRPEAALFEDDRVEKHMDAGDDLRRDFGHGGALAALAIHQISRLRGDTLLPKTAFLFRSLKHPAEVDLLRSIYESSLFVISVYAPEDTRLHHLRQKVKQSGRDEQTALSRAKDLIDRDEKGGDTDLLGQSVRDTFPKADFFLDASKDIRPQLARLIELIFRHPFHSPTKDEHAMALAHLSARRSADLSRQVGAAIVGIDGEVLATGCNEVPKPGGGVYWDGDDPDLRDHPRGEDPNAIIGREVLEEVLGLLKDKGWLVDEHSDKDATELVRVAQESGMFERARIASLIEFGRVVHAEMNALALAARRGTAVGGARLYCTTLPCHVCARHLLGAGLSEVVYIEPYPKSLAERLYPNAIVLGDEGKGDHLCFRPFTGVAPMGYLELFGYGRRKDEQGYSIPWDPKSAQPRTRRVANPHLLAEKELSAKLLDVLAERGWAPEDPDGREDSP